MTQQLVTAPVEPDLDQELQLGIPAEGDRRRESSPDWVVRRENLPGNGLRTIIVGAGAAGRSLARDLVEAPEFGLEPIGFIDDRPATGPLRVPVLGPIAALPEMVREHRADVVVVAIPSLPPARMREVLAVAGSTSATVRYLPTFLAAMERDMTGGDLRIAHMDALLGRSERHVVSPAARAVVQGRRVLVTGAGGSIGSELCRQLSRFEPAALYLLDHDESNLHRLQLELTGEALLDSDELIIADIRDQQRIDSLFAELRPEVVFHAAAHKHLPLLERHPCEGVKSNVLGTEILVKAALAYGCERFVLISTDKAADPSSVLGATKRLAECVVRAHAGGAMKVGAVRFGNVLGSRGSLLSVVGQQLSRGESVTVTDPDVTRFFMTVEEAVGLVLEAGRMADQGEVFVLDMGEPVRIVDLVKRYASELRLTDVDIRFTGLRPGEKMHEALVSAEESTTPTDHPRIVAIHDDQTHTATTLTRLYSATERNASDAVRSELARLLTSYEPAEIPDAVDTTPYPDEF